MRSDPLVLLLIAALSTICAATPARIAKSATFLNRTPRALEKQEPADGGKLALETKILVDETFKVSGKLSYEPAWSNAPAWFDARHTDPLLMSMTTHLGGERSPLLCKAGLNSAGGGYVDAAIHLLGCKLGFFQKARAGPPVVVIETTVPLLAGVAAGDLTLSASGTVRDVHKARSLSEVFRDGGEVGARWYMGGLTLAATTVLNILPPSYEDSGSLRLFSSHTSAGVGPTPPEGVVVELQSLSSLDGSAPAPSVLTASPGLRLSAVRSGSRWRLRTRCCTR